MRKITAVTGTPSPMPIGSVADESQTYHGCSIEIDSSLMRSASPRQKNKPASGIRNGGGEDGNLPATKPQAAPGARADVRSGLAHPLLLPNRRSVLRRNSSD